MGNYEPKIGRKTANKQTEKFKFLKKNLNF